MKIITISREFGSGGRELGKRMAGILGFDYYDKEIIATLAEQQRLHNGSAEQALRHHGWQTVPLTFRRSFAGAAMQSVQTGVLLEHKRIIEQIAGAGKDCVIVGRNADVLLKDCGPFNLFVCAEMKAKLQRCMERASENERLNAKELERKIRQIDKNRAKIRDIITGSRWGEHGSYHLIINTTGWNIKELTPAAAGFV